MLEDDVSVNDEHGRLRRERKTVRTMVEMYCAHHHVGSHLCEQCTELAAYADRRLDLCPYGEVKPACSKCPIHCYKSEPREKMREVMRFAGPRMMTKHPWLAIMHLHDDRRRAPPLPRSSGSSSDGEE